MGAKSVAVTGIYFPLNSFSYSVFVLFPYLFCCLDCPGLCLCIYCTTHNTTAMPLVGFKPSIPACDRLQTHASDRAAARIKFQSLDQLARNEPLCGLHYPNPQGGPSGLPKVLCWDMSELSDNSESGMNLTSPNRWLCALVMDTSLECCVFHTEVLFHCHVCMLENFFLFI
jgi:hypothetical protein